ncbi:rhodanese family protein [Pyruvatibacter mobilis]|uniref:rhodanese family protein n=1 Tax=Pyruvatibacter mobilis TaxID=1712261 RepID=UPI003BAB072D
MSLHPLTPEDAKLRIAGGARLVDVRERDEHLRERIAGAACVPAARVPQDLDAEGSEIIFHCRSGARTAAHAPQLAGAAGGRAYVLAGGIEAWKKAGFETQRTPKAPIEIMRQVQMTAGGLVLAGVVLGVAVAPEFFALSAFVGAGLFFAGATGWCGMAKLLALMPWNRQPSLQG